MYPTGHTWGAEPKSPGKPTRPARPTDSVTLSNSWVLLFRLSTVSPWPGGASRTSSGQCLGHTFTVSFQLELLNIHFEIKRRPFKRFVIHPMPVKVSGLLSKSFLFVSFLAQKQFLERLFQKQPNTKIKIARLFVMSLISYLKLFKAWNNVNFSHY